MTRYAGSRASGYPPDFMPFRRSAGATPTSTACKNAGTFLQAVSPSVSLGRNVRESPEVGRVYQRQRPILTRDTDIQKKAAPTRATPNKLGSGRDGPQRIKVLADQSAKSRTIEQNKFRDLTSQVFHLVIFRFRSFAILQNWSPRTQRVLTL